MRLPAPRRRFFRSAEPEVQVHDSITCMLRVPPSYHEIELFAEVVRADRPDTDPEAIHLGLRFFCDVQGGVDRNLSVLRRLLGRAGASSEDTPLATQPARASAKAPAAKTPAASKAESKTEEARESRRSRRLRRQGSSGSQRISQSRRSKRVRESKRLSAETRRVRAEDETDEADELFSETAKTQRVPRAEPRRRKAERPAPPPDEDSDASWELGPLPQERATSQVADALKADLFSDESWSNYLGGPPPAAEPEPKAKRKAEPKSKKTSVRAPKAAARATSARTRSASGSGTGKVESKSSSRSRRTVRVPRVSSGPDTLAPAQTPEAVSHLAPTVAVPAPSAELAPTRLDTRPSPTAAPPQAAPTPQRAASPVVYTSLGGPENGLYVRGTSRLDKGQARVTLPEHFAQLVDDDSITVQVTPRGQCMGLYVARAKASALLVRELAGGESDARFDYLVLGTRKR